MAAVLERTAPPQATAFVRDAVARMQAAPRFFNQAEWDALAAYEGPVVSGCPCGRGLPAKHTPDGTVPR